MRSGKTEWLANLSTMDSAVTISDLAPGLTTTSHIFILSKDFSQYHYELLRVSLDNPLPCEAISYCWNAQGRCN